MAPRRHRVVEHERTGRPTTSTEHALYPGLRRPDHGPRRRLGGRHRALPASSRRGGCTDHHDRPQRTRSGRPATWDRDTRRRRRFRETGDVEGGTRRQRAAGERGRRPRATAAARRHRARPFDSGLGWLFRIADTHQRGDPPGSRPVATVPSGRGRIGRWEDRDLRPAASPGRRHRRHR